MYGMAIKRKFEDLCCIIILGIMSFLLLYNNTYITYIGGDTGDGAYSVMAGMAQTIHNGEFPLWNPYMWGGMTSAGNSVSQAFYPITWLLCKLCFDETTGMLSYSAVYYSNIIHIFILAAGSYLLFRVMKVRSVIAFSAASLMTFCGSAFRMHGWLYIYSGLVYIPLFLSTFTLMCRDLSRKGLKYCALSGIVFGIAGLAASSHGILFLILAFAVAYFVFLWSYRAKKQSLLKITARCFLLSAIGIGIMSVSLFPFIEFLSESYRSIEGAEGIQGNQKMTLESFTKFAVEMSDLRDIVGSYYGWFALGTVLALLVIIGFFCKVKRDKEMYWIGVGLLLIGLFYSCAIWLPNLMYYVPFYNNIREPYLYSFLFALGAGIVGGIGLNTLIEVNGTEKYSEKFYNIPGIFAGVTIIAIYMLFVQKGRLSAFVGIAGILLVPILQRLIKRRTYYVVVGILLVVLTGTEYLTFRQSEGEKGRYSELDAEKVMQDTNKDILRLLGDSDYPSEEDAYRIVQWTTQASAYPPNVWSVWGYNDASGYMNPLYSKTMNIHSNWSLEKQMQIRNVRYLVCTAAESEGYQKWLKEVGLQEVRRVQDIRTAYDAEVLTEDIVYENENRKGNAWFVNNWIGYTADSDLNELNNIVNSIDFNPFTTALINLDTSEIEMKKVYADPEQCDMTMKKYNANSVVFELSVPEEALMITSEIIVPGWEVYIDGEKADILEVNTAFRGVIVPEGEHVVEYRYLPKTVLIGAILGIISMCGAIVVISVSLKKGKDTNE